MSWVLIDQEKCNQCGLCLTRCVMCFSKKNETVVARADQECCNLCGHCVSLCPTGAISHSMMDMSNFIDIEKKVAFASDDFIQFVKERRSHRFFKNQEVSRQILENLVDLCRYAPTGSNQQTVEIKVVQNPQRRKLLSDLAVDYFQETIDDLEKEYKRFESEGKEIPADFREVYDAYKRRRLLIAARDFGIDTIFYSAPAVMIFHSKPQLSTPKDDCVIAAHTVVLTARTMGLETCYIGLFEKAALEYAPLKEALNLPKANQVYSVLILGYPKFKYQRTVARNPIQTTWE